MSKISKDHKIKSQFTVMIDTREQNPYTFSIVPADATQQKNGLPKYIEVPTMRTALAHGDYSIFGYPRVGVERKSLADLFSSIAKRDNFVGRLERMSAELDYSAVVVEAEISTIMQSPPPFTQFPAKSVVRTILAWSVRYPVRWWFLPGREAAEVWTYRILERYWKDRMKDEGKDWRKVGGKAAGDAGQVKGELGDSSCDGGFPSVE